MLKVNIPEQWISLSEEKPDTKEVVVFKAFNIEYVEGKYYTTDPWCGWIDKDSKFIRWPHKFNPTHFIRLP